MGRFVAIVTCCGALGLSGVASAHHSYPMATYTGTAATGGSVTMVVRDSLVINTFEVRDVPTTCGTMGGPAYSGEWMIDNHAFNIAGGVIIGRFPTNGQATGTLQVRTATCTSDPVPWTATTSAPPPPQCNDGADNDGDGKVDSPSLTFGPPGPRDPGCEDSDDNSEADASPAPGGAIVASGLSVRAGTISYRLSTAGKMTFKLDRVRSGRRVGGRCVKPTRANRQRPRCSRYVRLTGVLIDFGTAGANSVAFRNRWRGARLPAGRYRLTGVPENADGDTGAAVRTLFSVRR